MSEYFEAFPIFMLDLSKAIEKLQADISTGGEIIEAKFKYAVRSRRIERLGKLIATQSSLMELAKKTLDSLDKIITKMEDNSRATEEGNEIYDFQIYRQLEKVEPSLNKIFFGNC